jgi:hypothetical protein
MNLKLTGYGGAIVLGLGLSVVAVALLNVAALWLGTTLALKLILVLLSALYLTALLVSHGVRFGASLVVLAWLLLSAALLLVNPALSAWLIGYVALAWLVRSSKRYQKMWLVICDGLLALVALCAAVSAFWYSQSLFLSFWTFFLLQALVYWLPGQALNPLLSRNHSNNRFQQARHSAQQALARINR